jgi:hypothetical protein
MSKRVLSKWMRRFAWDVGYAKWHVRLGTWRLLESKAYPKNVIFVAAIRYVPDSVRTRHWRFDDEVFGYRKNCIAYARAERIVSQGTFFDV